MESTLIIVDALVVLCWVGAFFVFLFLFLQNEAFQVLTRLGFETGVVGTKLVASGLLVGGRG